MFQDPQDAPDFRFIDLHAHTTASDGSFTPEELIAHARHRGLSALAITDHDTFAGYDDAAPFARQVGFELIRGIELNTRLELGPEGEHKSAHLLGYWPANEPSAEFHAWLAGEREERRSRNRLLAGELQRRGVKITLEEVEQVGRSLAGRTHFARVLIEKGYAKDFEDAFQRYLGAAAPSYVERQSHTTAEAIVRITSGGGIPVIAHPVRLSLPGQLELSVFRELKQAGLLGLEVCHSEHPPALEAHYRQIAEELHLLPTGGSDFHGTAKPDVELGTGRNGNVRVPYAFLAEMRQFVPAAIVKT